MQPGEFLDFFQNQIIEPRFVYVDLSMCNYQNYVFVILPNASRNLLLLTSMFKDTGGNKTSISPDLF